MNADATERRIEAFIAKYTPAIAAQLRDARQRLRAHFPRGVEMVFDNYNALVFGIGPTDRTRESFISIAGYPKWVTLFFLDGAGGRHADRAGRRAAPRGARGRGAADHGDQGRGREAAAAPTRRHESLR